MCSGLCLEQDPGRAKSKRPRMEPLLCKTRNEKNPQNTRFLVSDDGQRGTARRGSSRAIPAVPRLRTVPDCVLRGLPKLSTTAENSWVPGRSARKALPGLDAHCPGGSRRLGNWTPAAKWTVLTQHQVVQEKMQEDRAMARRQEAQPGPDV